jgi:hypothetical protein
MVHHLILLSSGRSGTHLHQTMMRQGLETAVVLGELFNPSSPFGLEAQTPEFIGLLEEECGIEVDLGKARALASYVREDPVVFLNALSTVCDRLGHDYLYYSILPKQLAGRWIEDILFKFGCSCSFLTRERLARYVSLVKARKLGAWKWVDTTSLKPEISMEGFLEDARATDDWFQFLSERVLTAGLNVRHLSYGADLNQPARSAFYSLQRTYQGICALTPFDFGQIPEFKQERGADPFRSIANGDHIRDALQQAALLDYAFTEPDVFSADGYV